jgi:hypothetical protein
MAEESKGAASEGAAEAQAADSREAPPAGDTPPAAEAPGSEPASSGAASDPWAPFDPILQTFGEERGLALGTYWDTNPADAAGRFAAWSNTAGWRCTLQLVHAPEESSFILVAQGPPLPGNRPRMMPVGQFPAVCDQAMVRAGLEVGFLMAETWGPMAEPPPEPRPEPSEPDATAAPQSEGSGAEGSAP